MPKANGASDSASRPGDDSYAALQLAHSTLIRLLAARCSLALAPPEPAIEAPAEGIRHALRRLPDVTPVGFAASQGALSSLAMALGKELGPRGIRVNQVALGFLEEGLSHRFVPELREDFKRYSALHRFGSAEEAARAIVWLALENTYINGKVIPVNGGL